MPKLTLEISQNVPFTILFAICLLPRKIECLVCYDCIAPDDIHCFPLAWCVARKATCNQKNIFNPEAFQGGSPEQFRCITLGFVEEVVSEIQAVRACIGTYAGYDYCVESPRKPEGYERLPRCYVCNTDLCNDDASGTGSFHGSVFLIITLVWILDKWK